MLDTAIAPFTHSGRVDFPAEVAQKINHAKAADRDIKTNADAELVDAVGRALCATGLPALREIEIESDRRIVVLWGRVPNYHQKQLAQATAQKVDGVRGVANGVEVICRR